MSERKWIEVEVGVSYDSWAVCEPLDRSGDAVSGTPFVVLPMGTLRDAPDDEQLRLLESLKDERGAMLDRIADAAGVNTWQESVSAISALRDWVAELREGRDAGRDAWKRAARSWEDCSKEIERDRDALRDRVAELERERDEARREAEELRERIREMTGVQRELARHANAYQRELLEVRRENERLREERDSWRASAENLEAEVSRMESLRDDARDRVAELEQERDEARSEAEAARAHSNADRNATNKACRERDAARREAAELRAENERLHDIACSKLADELETTPKDDQPAPQTHFRSGDVTVNAGGDYRRLGNLIRVDKDDGIEEWESADAPSGSVVLSVTESPILERDGVPTDEGLRRLAERAGLEFATMDYQALRFTTSETEASLSERATDDDRRGLAAALREMGGA